MAEDPEIIHGNELPEVFYAPAKTRPDKSYASISQKESAHGYPTICGLRRTTFWLLMLLAIVVVAAAVGGGVGGSLAVQNAKSSTYTTTAPSSQTASIPPSASSTLPNASTSISTLPNTSTSIYSAPAASSIPLLDVGCLPGSRASYIIAGSYNTSATFKVFCNQNYAGDDLTGIVAYSINDCIDACLTMSNYINKNDICVGITIQAGLSNVVLTNHGANCWLKGASSLPTLAPFVVGDSGGSARLCKDSSCGSFV